MSDYEEVIAIRDRLRRTWHPFFSRFGILTPVQIATIPVILSGKNALICAPTATGKTEAIVGPISELVLESGQENLACVYVSPTRALVNDLVERLSEPLREIDLTLGMWTGDHHSFKKQSPSNFLLTTPESLDSVLCRFSQCFEKVKFVVFDELHLVDGTCRGDQLMVLAERLKVLSGSPRFYGLSATIKNPEEVARRYFGGATCIKVLGGREIQERLIDGSNIENGLSEVIAEFKRENITKALFFCNSRAEAEDICLRLKARFEEDRVFVHHGSLPREIREAAEKAFKERRFCFCVATMTLEVGIDIGDIDAVVLVGTPPSVSSLLQRIGRGSRRKAHTTVIGVAKSDLEKQTFEKLFELAKKGELEDVTWNACLSVGVQQILSIAFQNRKEGVRIESLASFTRALGFADENIRYLVSHLEKEEYLTSSRRLVFPSQKTMDLAERGFIHSNIGTDKGYKVINALTGEKLGEIGLLDIHQENLILGGRTWEVSQIRDSDVLVIPTKRPTGMVRFVRRGRRGAFYSLLPADLRTKTLC